MKEFMRTLKQVYLANKKDILIYLLVALIVGIIGIGMVILVMAVEGSGESYAQMGALMSLMISLILFFFAGIFSVGYEFNLAVSMGKTRKWFLLAEYLMLVLDIAAPMLVIIGIGFAENLLYERLYPGAECEFFIVNSLLQPKVILSIVLGGAMVVLLLGALVTRFATKAAWIVWALWMVVCIGFSKLVPVMTDTPDSALAVSVRGIMNCLGNLSLLQTIIILLGVIGAGMAAVFALLRRQHVTA